MSGEHFNRNASWASIAFAILFSALALVVPVNAEATVGVSYILEDNPAVACGTGLYANGTVANRQMAVYAPLMYSVVANTPGGASATVSYRPVLWDICGGRWVRILTGIELRGGAGLFGLPEYGLFNINRGGSFAASIILRWYSINGALIDEQHVWAGSNYRNFRMLHTGAVQDFPRTNGYCTF